MRNTGKLMATSFIAGAAAAIYASKHMNKTNETTSAADNNTYEAITSTFTQNATKGSNQTSAQKNNSFTSASPSGIDYNYDAGATSTTTQTPYNVYLENEDNTQFAGVTSNNTFSSNSTNTTENANNGTPNTKPDTTIRIDVR